MQRRSLLVKRLDCLGDVFESMFGVEPPENNKEKERLLPVVNELKMQLGQKVRSLANAYDGRGFILLAPEKWKDLKNGGELELKLYSALNRHRIMIVVADKFGFPSLIQQREERRK